MRFVILFDLDQMVGNCPRTDHHNRAFSMRLIMTSLQCLPFNGNDLSTRAGSDTLDPTIKVVRTPGDDEYDI